MFRKYNENPKPISQLLTKKKQYEKQENQQPQEKPIRILSQEEQHQQEFEDQFQDQFENQEDAWVDQDNSSSSSEQDQGNKMQQQKKPKKKTSARIVEEKPSKKRQVFLGTNKTLEKGQTLQFDNNAYDMLHRLTTEWPSLSIDFVCKSSPFEDFAGFKKVQKYPLEIITVQGSSNNTNNNSVYLTKWSRLHRTKYDDDPQAEDDDSLNGDEDPILTVQQIQTGSNINRIRSLANSPVIAFWNQSGQIHLMDLTQNYQKLLSGVGSKKKQKSKQIILHSSVQGFGLSWNPHQIGQLVTGNNNGIVEIFQNNENFTSWSKISEYAYHKGSVEDIVFSPNEPSVFASCSSDGTLQIVDMRIKSQKKSQLKINAHLKDVNVCDWNKVATHLIVTGSDDCTVKVWDLRMHKFDKKSQELLCFNWHTQPITSLRFQPNQQSVIAVASEDNRLSMWDMSMQNEEVDPQVPNQLMFLHQGQQQIKQICFHPIYYQVLVSSAINGINILKPSLEMPQQQYDDQEDLKRPPIKQQDLDQFLGKMKIQ